MGRVSCSSGPVAAKGSRALRAKDCSALVHLPLCFCPRMSLRFQILCLKWLKHLPKGRWESEAREATLTLLVMHSSATLVCSSLCCRVSAWLWMASWACCCLWMRCRLLRTSACRWLTVPCNSLISLFCSASLDSCSVTT